jgi:hypothetical protein
MTGGAGYEAVELVSPEEAGWWVLRVTIHCIWVVRPYRHSITNGFFSERAGGLPVDIPNPRIDLHADELYTEKGRKQVSIKNTSSE